MKYDLFLLHVREDSSFAKAVAQSLQRYNISVLYQCVLAKEDSISDAIDSGFQQCLFGIIIFSRNVFKQRLQERELDYIYSYATLSNQILHIIWHEVNEYQVQHWSSKLAECIAIQSPPESPDSIARKFQMKLAGTPELQYTTLSGNHPKIQYIAPKITTYRDPKGAELLRKTLDQERQEDIAQDIDNAENVEDEDEVEGKQEHQDTASPVQNLEDQPITCFFDLNIREGICKRLDVYLRGLSNWKDLAVYFQLGEEETTTGLQSSGVPTMNLLNLLAHKGVTLGEFKAACLMIKRNDVVDYVESQLPQDGSW